MVAIRSGVMFELACKISMIARTRSAYPHHPLNPRTDAGQQLIRYGPDRRGHLFERYLRAAVPAVNQHVASYLRARAVGDVNRHRIHGDNTHDGAFTAVDGHV